jgi:ubiquinone/menaquinone biosynthesis C-methylase UbiE
MDVRSAARLIRDAVPSVPGTWADLGAGTGTFTLALAGRLGSEGRVVAIDSDASALETLRQHVLSAALGNRVDILRADFRKPIDLHRLDGVLLANALHFVPKEEQLDVLGRVGTLLRPGGRVVVVEYEGRAANPWVPHPVSSARLAELVLELKMAPLSVVATRPSRYGGSLYAAFYSNADHSHCG